MKSLPFLSAALLLLAVTANAAPVPARIGSVRGEVQLIRNGQPTPLKAGTAIQAGDTLAVGPESEARVSLGESASELILGPGSELRLDKLSISSTGIENALDAAIALEKGDLRGYIGRLSDLSKFEIVLGKCRHQIGVGQATRFALSADGTLRVRSGCINSSCEGKPSFSVCGGEKYVPALGLTVAMTPPELSSPIWNIGAAPQPPTIPYQANGTPNVFVSPFIGASISPSAP
jgi:hypothetical protein